MISKQVHGAEKANLYKKKTHLSNYCAPFNFYDIMHEILVTSAFGNNNKTAPYIHLLWVC